MNWDQYKTEVAGSRAVIVFPFFESSLSNSSGIGVDVGCGNGDLTSHIAKSANASVVGTDSDGKSLQEARKNHPELHFVRGAVEKNALSSIGLIFDFAFSNCCFCHLSDDGVHDALYDLFSCMREGGEFVLLVPSISWAKEMYGEVSYEVSGITAVPRYGGRQYFRSADWYAAGLRKCGFEVVSHHEIAIPSDERLEERYLERAGRVLFSGFVAKRSGALPSSKEMEKAFDVAHDNRKLEIQLFWQRSLFFWGFVAAALVGYGAAYNAKSDLQLLFALFGLVCSVVWSAGNRGSKYWQEYWENKVNLLQHYVTGNIFYDRKPSAPDLFDVFAARRTSVSKLTMALSDYAVFLWLVLCILSAYRTSHMEWPKLVAVVSMQVATLMYCLWIVRKSKSED